MMPFIEPSTFDNKRFAGISVGCTRNSMPATVRLVMPSNFTR